MDCRGRLVALAMTAARHCERRTFYLSLRRSGADEAIQGGALCGMDWRGRLVALAMTPLSVRNGLPRLFRGLKAHREMFLSAVARRERGAFFGGARAAVLEAAARGEIGGSGDISRNAPERMQVRTPVRNGGKERPGVRVHRVRDHGFRRAGFDDAPGVHHGDALRVLSDQPHVVR